MARARAVFWLMMGEGYQLYGVRTGFRRFFDRAHQAFCSALQADPTLDLALYRRAVLAWRERQAPDEAIADFTALLGRSSNYGDSLFLRGMAYQQIGDFQAAALDLEHFLVVMPGSRWREAAGRQLELVKAILAERPAALPSPGCNLLGSGPDL